MRCTADVTQLVSSIGDGRNQVYFNLFHEEQLGWGGIGVWACANHLTGPAILARPSSDNPALVAFIQFNTLEHLAEWLTNNQRAEILWRSDVAALAAPREREEGVCRS